MGFVANFIRFPAVQNFENRLRFDKVTESLKVGTFLRHNVHCIGIFCVLSIDNNNTTRHYALIFPTS